MRSGKVRCHGITVDDTRLDGYLSGKEWHYDMRHIREQAADISRRTGFDTDRLVEDLLATRPTPKYWQVAESLAHCTLEDYWFANFPYKGYRDAKNPKASLAGADMVGLYHRNGTTTILLGEVKTSSETRRPPRVLTHSMTALKDRNAQLVIWLVQKFADVAADDPNKKRCDAAIDAYVRDGMIRLVGVIIRDTPPDKADLQLAFERLVEDTSTHVDMCALYLPISIHQLTQK